ncbi:MAG: 50S ribosomal protein L13 [Sphaerochaetaceae bacterium]|jgi:large subunit ribosomal protein L13
MKTIYVKPASIEKKWYLIDAEGKRLGRVAALAAKILRGKHKPEFAPLHDNGDFVIIINAEKAALSGNKVEDKIYYRHSNYPGGLKQENYASVVARKPTFPMEHAVKGMLPKGPLGNKMFTKVKVYAGSDHPHAAQQPITLEM